MPELAQADSSRRLGTPRNSRSAGTGIAAIIVTLATGCSEPYDCRLTATCPPDTDASVGAPKDRGDEDEQGPPTKPAGPRDAGGELPQGSSPVEAVPALSVLPPGPAQPTSTAAPVSSADAAADVARDAGQDRPDAAAAVGTLSPDAPVRVPDAGSSSDAGTDAAPLPGPTCGDGFVEGSEVCDGAGRVSTELGACNPQCSGFYERKTLRLTDTAYGTDLGGIDGADAICEDEFGVGWKALLVGGQRRATLTPFMGDAQQDWVIRKFTHYFNASSELVWRTDDVALLGVRAGSRHNLYARLYEPESDSQFSGPYAWAGYANDWTTLPDTADSGTCEGWTVDDVSRGLGVNLLPPDAFTAGGELMFATTSCGASSQHLVCVEQ